MTISLDEVPGRLPLTAADYAEIEAPDGVRLELSEGTLEMAAAAQMAWHTEMARRICNMFIDGGRVSYREIGVVLGPHDVRSPDVTRFKAGFVPDLRRSQFQAAEVDLAVEVISTGSRKRDRMIKPIEYAQASIPEYWLVEDDAADPNGAIVNIYQLTLHPNAQEYVLVRRVSLDDLEKETPRARG